MESYGDMYNFWEVYHHFEDYDCDLVKLRLNSEDFTFTRGSEYPVWKMDVMYCRDEEYLRCEAKG